MIAKSINQVWNRFDKPSVYIVNAMDVVVAVILYMRYTGYIH